jgi:hypothetical protein
VEDIDQQILMEILQEAMMLNEERFKTKKK